MTMGSPSESAVTAPDKNQLRRKNLRMGLTLASVAIVFFVGFMVKLVFFSR